MKPTLLDASTMTPEQKDKAIADLARILYPAKGLHVLTLIALTTETYTQEKKGEKT